MNPFNSNSNSNNTGFDFQMQQLMNNPMFQLLKQRGMTPEQMVRYICQQRGINVEQFMKQIGNTK